MVPNVPNEIHQHLQKKLPHAVFGVGAKLLYSIRVNALNTMMLILSTTKKADASLAKLAQSPDLCQYFRLK